MEHKKKVRVKALEESLSAQLAEMKGDLTDKDLRDVLRSASSIGRVKSSQEYAKDREVCIKRLLQVPKLYPLPSQAQAMCDDVTTSTKHTYTADNMPLLLHHFYCQRLEELVRLRHTLLVRWARFAVGVAKVTEELQEPFKLRMEHILAEFNHTLERSRILSQAMDCVLADKTTPTSLVSEEDVLVYLRWLLHQQHVTKNLEGFIRSLQWYPMLHHQQFSQALSSLPPPTAHPTTADTNNGHAPHHLAPPTRSALSSLLQQQGSRHSRRGSPDQKVGVVCSGLPRLTTSVSDLQALIQELCAHYAIEGDPTLRSQADELQLYHRVNRRFGEVFAAQESAFTLHTYDRLPSNGSKRQQKSKLTFKKPSNWVSYVKVRPHPHPVQIEAFAQIRQSVTEVDEFLALSSHCTHLHSLQRVLYALRQHYVFVKHTSTSLTPLSLKDHATSHDMSLIWKCIYSGVDSRNPLGSEDDVSASEVGGASGADHTPTEGVFDLGSAMKLIHHPGGRSVSAKARSSPNDGYFAFLLLRHLRIREERHKCLNILNYFRSIERTLTINEEGLSLDSSTGEQRSSRTSGLLDHRHLFNTPADYVIDQSEFMQYMEVENHDDFYSFETTNQVRVWDQQGLGVVYDSALQDLSALETELLTVASYYLARCPLKESQTSHRGGEGETLDTGGYAQVGVDRFSILWEVWRAEAKFLLAKMRVINCYLECYHHTSNKSQRTRLAEVITTLLWARPRYDPTAQYFTSVYEGEVRVLGVYSRLLQEMITAQLDRERLYTERVCGRGSAVSAMDTAHGATPTPYGLPHPLIPKQLVSLSGDRHLPVHSYLLECAGSLGELGRLPEAIQWSLAETIKMQGVCGVRETLTLHHQLLETILHEWKERRDVGSAFTHDLQAHLFSDVVAEDPKVMIELCVTRGNQAAKEAEVKGVPPKEQAVKRLQGWVETVQLTVTRHHLILTCLDTRTLTRLYKQQLARLDQEAYHAHLRHSSFDLSRRTLGDKDLDYYVTKTREGDVGGDRCAVGALKLAVNELDEKNVGVFSFQSQEGINKILSVKGGLEGVVVATTCQLSHRHALLVACQHNHLIVQGTLPPGGGANSTSTASSSSAGAPPTAAVDQSELSVCTIKKLKKSFLSIQLEKAPVRDYMLFQFTKQPSSLLRDQSELTVVKCSLISSFSAHLMCLFSVTSLRVQLAHQLHDLHTLLAQFPAVKSSFFTVGKPRDSSALSAQGSGYVGSSSSMRHKISFERLQQMGGVKDPRQMKARPVLLLDRNGEKLMNLWYLPHFTEVFEMFEQLPMDRARQALEKALHLVSALHMFLQYTCAYVKLGHTSNQRVGGAWGGVESIGSQLLQLQSEISRLSDPASPDEVGRYLWLRCNVAHLAHTLTVEHHLRYSLLHKDQSHALHQLDCVSVPALRQLHPPHTSHLPPPLDILPDAKTSTLVPRHYFDSAHHSLSLTSDHTHLIGSYVHSSLAVLDQEHLNLAHGELLAVSLRLEDVLKTSDLSSSTPEPATNTRIGSAHQRLLSPAGSLQSSQRGRGSWTTSSMASSTHSPRHQLPNAYTPTPHSLPSVTLLTSPLESAELLVKFLTVSHQLGRLKMEWGLKMLNIHALVDRKDLLVLEDSYREKVYNKARNCVARQQMKELARLQLETDSIDASSAITFMTETTVTDHAPTAELLENSEALSELAVEQAQVTHLCEMLDNGLIQETIKQLSKLHHLMLSERERDHTTLPLDLWKNTAMNTKEITGLPRSHAVEDFVRLLESKMSDNGNCLSITKGDLKQCVQLLANGVMAREKDCYHLYASYYEALLRSQYNQLYQKNQDIEHYRGQAEEGVAQSREESLIFMGEHTQGLLLEITALRNKVRELLRQLTAATNHTHVQVQQEYSQLVNNLFSATMCIKSRYEDYRGHLYDDVTRSLYEVRQLAADSVKKMKDKLGVQASGDITTTEACADNDATVTRLKDEGMKDIQQENADLSKLVIKMRAVHSWNDYKDSVGHHHKVASLEGQLDSARVECLELRMKTEQEISSLKQQLLNAQRSVARLERECEVVRQSLQEERRKKNTSIKQHSKAQEAALRVRGERSKVAKLEQLKRELEVKERMLKEVAEEKDLANRQVSTAKVQSSKVTKELKQQLRHERHLKSDAFHQVDELLAQVEEYTQQESKVLRLSLQAMSRTPLVSSSPSAVAGRSLATPTPSGRQPKPAVGKSGRRDSGGETIDLKQEILALKLI